MVELFGAFRGWWCCMFPGPDPWPIGHQFVGWGVIKKKIEIPTTLLAQQALTLSTTFREIMTRELQLWKSIFLKERKKIQRKILLFFVELEYPNFVAEIIFNKIFNNEIQLFRFWQKIKISIMNSTMDPLVRTMNIWRVKSWVVWEYLWHNFLFLGGLLCNQPTYVHIRYLKKPRYNCNWMECLKDGFGDLNLNAKEW